MRTCLSCDRPLEGSDSFVDGLCEKCHSRIEGLRGDLRRARPTPEKSVSFGSEDGRISADARIEAVRRASARATTSFGMPATVVALFLMLAGVFVAGLVLDLESRLGVAVIYGGLLFTGGLYGLFTALAREAVAPLAMQNAELVRLLEEIAASLEATSESLKGRAAPARSIEEKESMMDQ